MIGDHHGRSAGPATLLVRAVDAILGTHNATADKVTIDMASGRKPAACRGQRPAWSRRDVSL
jgi:hypothetical protein